METKITEFRTHTGEIVTGERLVAALNAVADDKIKLAHAIYEEDAYASHVDQKTKDSILQKSIETAEKIRRGEVMGFWVWQPVNKKLTGECIGFLP